MPSTFGTWTRRSTPRDRAVAALGAGLIVTGMGWALIRGLGWVPTTAPSETLALFEVPPDLPPPPQKQRPERVPSRKREGEAAPPALKADPTEIVAPPVPAVVPPPVAAAPVAGTGSAPSAGNALVPGPGTGSGGQGNGRGSGGRGDGDGDGGDEVPPQWRSGRLRDSDYPRAAAEAGASGTVSVRYLVGVDGRAHECRVTRSSGNADLDATTCRLIEQRFRFRPSRDAQGRPVAAYLVENHSWEALAPLPEPSPTPRHRRLSF